MRLAEGLAELLSPTRCAGCELPGALLCPDCEGALPRIDPRTACPRCGAPTRGGACVECAGRAFAFAGARCLGTLEPPLSRMVVLHKDAGERRLGAVLGALAAEVWLATPPAAPAVPPEAVTFVPASRDALRHRGFDHAEGIAHAVAARLGLPCVRALTRVRGGDQRALGRDARLAALSCAFAPGPEPTPPRVLLVDDVFTTGATLHAAALALRASGCAEVLALALARACGG
ncbi:MAG: ComF family protein [Coriobacteriaceae bacterium]|nr:ComF family protein [Coriobacteriaceae bacterium]